MLIHIPLLFIAAFVAAVQATRRAEGAAAKIKAFPVTLYKGLKNFVVFLLWPPAWMAHVGKIAMGEARGIVAQKERMEKETRRLEKNQRKSTHFKGMRKASSLGRKDQRCKRPPEGLTCTRKADHSGPCATPAEPCVSGVHPMPETL